MNKQAYPSRGKMAQLLDHKGAVKRGVDPVLFPQHFSCRHFFFSLAKDTNYIALCLLNISIKSGTLTQNDYFLLKMGLSTELLWSVTSFHY